MTDRFTRGWYPEGACRKKTVGTEDLNISFLVEPFGNGYSWRGWATAYDGERCVAVEVAGTYRLAAQPEPTPQAAEAAADAWLAQVATALTVQK